MAQATGGRAFVVKDGKQLQAALMLISQELRSAYVVNFRPRNPVPGFHRVEVAPQHPKELRVRCRAGYFATP
jgi:hypothetical protein